MPKITQTFVNLSVKDLKKTIAFFTQLGFKFNPKFTDDNATCLIINENSFAMLLTEPFFKTFSKKEICDASKSMEVITSLALGSRAEVDEMIDKALAAGASEARAMQDMGWMYVRTIEDLDRHTWEFFYMNEAEMPKEMQK